jgi:serine/threonine protein kinase
MSPEAPSAQALVGSVLEGAYRVESLVGEGGMGAVYSGVHLRLGKRVAIKVMARELAANPEALARFRREAEVTSGLGHPHIVQVFDFGATPTGEPYLVMEFLEGEDLEHRIRRSGRVPPPATMHIVRQVASALAATHRRGIVHRDLKPANIYLLAVEGETDFVKVLDFGISKVRAATTKLTQPAMVMGTPNYMSPEQALGQVDEIDERTDQWALACITWEALSGQGPFVGDNVPSLLFQVVHEIPAPLVPKVPGLPAEVESVLRRALSKKKNERFSGVAEFAGALEGAMAASAERPPKTELLVEDQSAAAAKPESSPSFPSTFTQTAGDLLDTPPSRRKWPWAVAAAAALLVGGLLLFRGAPAPTPASSPQAPPVAATPAPAPAPTPAPVEKPPEPEKAVPVVPGPVEAEQPTEPGAPRNARRKVKSGSRSIQSPAGARAPAEPPAPPDSTSRPPVSPPVRPKVQKKLVEEL